jgi:hypothetical protein
MHDRVGWVIFADERLLIAAVAPTSAATASPRRTLRELLRRTVLGRAALDGLLGGVVVVVLVAARILFVGAVVEVNAGPTTATATPTAPPASPCTAVGIRLIDPVLVWTGIVLEIGVKIEQLDPRRLRSWRQEYRCCGVEDRQPSRHI